MNQARLLAVPSSRRSCCCFRRNEKLAPACYAAAFASVIYRPRFVRWARVLDFVNAGALPPT